MQEVRHPDHTILHSVPAAHCCTTGMPIYYLPVAKVLKVLRTCQCPGYKYSRDEPYLYLTITLRGFLPEAFTILSPGISLARRVPSMLKMATCVISLFLTGCHRVDGRWLRFRIVAEPEQSHAMALHRGMYRAFGITQALTFPDVVHRHACRHHSPAGSGRRYSQRACSHRTGSPWWCPTTNRYRCRNWSRSHRWCGTSYRHVP